MDVGFENFAKKDDFAFRQMSAAFWHEANPTYIINDKTLTQVFDEILNNDPYLQGQMLILPDETKIGYVLFSCGFHLNETQKFVKLEQLYFLPEYEGKDIEKAALLYMEYVFKEHYAFYVKIQPHQTSMISYCRERGYRALKDDLYYRSDREK